MQLSFNIETDLPVIDRMSEVECLNAWRVAADRLAEYADRASAYAERRELGVILDAIGQRIEFIEFINGY